MEKVILFIGIFCIIATLLPFIPSDQWWIRMFDFPHFQIFILTAIILLTAFIYFPVNKSRELLFLILLSATLIYQIIVIFPYTPLANKQVLSSDGGDKNAMISLLGFNVYMNNKESNKILALIDKYNPDIIVLMETNERWRSEMSILREKYPYYVEEPLENAYGMLLYSRLQLIEPKVKYIIKQGIPSIHTRVVLPSGKLVQLYAIHPEPPSPTETQRSTERDGELLLIGKMAAKDSLPVIVIGDLNDVSWSHSTKLFQNISHLLDPRVGRGFYNTFNANYFLLRWPLDYVFSSDDFKLVRMELLPHVNSDHFPTYTKLSLEPEAEQQQKEPKASPREKKQAEEDIKKAKQ